MKRVFFGFEAHAPWPQDLPEGRIVLPHQRHMTLAFMGSCDSEKLLMALKEAPLPPFKVGTAAILDRPLFLPYEDRPNVCAFHVSLFEKAQEIAQYKEKFCRWLMEKGFLSPRPDPRPWLPHVTICRQPFDKEKWRSCFVKLPAYLCDMHLYESLGNLTYKPLWSYSLLAPFKEMDHTADIAFKLCGHSLKDLYNHAKLALAFTHPPLLDYLEAEGCFESLEEIIIHLNSLIATADGEIGVPFKAISFHGDIKREDSLFTWEMIVDV